MDSKINELYKLYYNKHFSDTEEKCIIPLMGLIQGNKILFVGQNPGVPFQKEHIEIFKNFKSLSYEDKQEAFKLSWKKSLFIKFIMNVCSRLGISFDDVSVTNIVKYWTDKNSRPDITDDDQKLLACEIKLLAPEHVVFLSKYASNSFTYVDKIKTNYHTFDHPAVCRYNDIYAQYVADAINGNDTMT